MTEQITFKVKRNIATAIDEAKSGLYVAQYGVYTEDQVIDWAAKSSGCPYDLVEEVYNEL